MALDTTAQIVAIVKVIGLGLSVIAMIDMVADILVKDIGALKDKPFK